MHCLYLSIPLFKVLWRYKGKKPEALGSNTRTYDWIPQNDLLGETDSLWDALHPWKNCFICPSAKMAYLGAKKKIEKKNTCSYS